MKYSRIIAAPVALLCSCLIAGAFNLSLDDCREMALKTDETITIADNSLKAAGLNKDVAFTAYLPNFSGNASAIYSAPDTEFSGMTMQMRGVYLAGISLTQPVFAGGKIIAANRMAKAGEEIARQQLRASRIDVIANAEKSYWMYIAVLAKVDMMKSYLNFVDSIHAMTESSVELGMTTRQNLLRVESRRSEIVYRLKQAQAGADICRMALCRVIGVPDTVSITPTEPLTDRLDNMPAGASIDSRPEIAILTRNIDIKRHEVTMTRADYLPMIGLQVGWSAYGNIKMKGWTQDAEGNPVPFTSNTKNNGFLGMISVQVPLFHWGEGIKKTKAAKLEVENARLSLDHNRRLIQLEANQALSNLLTGRELIVSARLAFDESAENLRMMTDQYNVGMMTLTDLLEAQSQWHTSYSNLIEAQTQYRIYEIDYMRATGTIE